MRVRRLNKSTSALLIGVGVLGIYAGACVAFMAQPPCQNDSNCHADQRCDTETQTCVAREPVDAGDSEDGGLPDASAPDSAARDAALGDSAGSDSARPDSARPDSAAPDTARPDTWAPCIDGDGDGYGDNCALGPDCDDGDQDIYPGAICSDQVGETVADICGNDGTCAGFYPSGAGSCGNGCGNCATQTCCQEACGPQGCSACGAGCNCSFSFDRNQNLTASCEAGSTCSLQADSGRDITLTCFGASCYLRCEGNSGFCVVDCRDDARCLLICNGQSPCSIANCTGGEVSCPSGAIVCNRACPTDL